MSRSPKRLSSSAKKKRGGRHVEDDDQYADSMYDDDLGVSGLPRNFSKGLSAHIAKQLGVKTVQVTEIKSFLKVRRCVGTSTPSRADSPAALPQPSMALSLAVETEPCPI
jgi:hypothetical protein